MSITIYRRIPDGFVYAITFCDDCKKEIEHRPAKTYEHPGTILMVCNWCKDCSPKHSFPMDQLVREGVGMSIVNPSCVSKVTIKEEETQ